MLQPRGERTYALGFLLAFGIGVLGACLVGMAFLLFLNTPISSQPSPPTPVFHTPTPLATLPAMTPTTLPPTPTPLSFQPSPTPENPTPTVYTFAVLRVSEPPPCEQRGLIRGRVFDAQEQGLGDLRVHLFNDFGYSVFFYTWVDNPVGYYEFFMGPQSGTFHLQIVDTAGQPISPAADVKYEGGCVSEVDWQRNF